MNLRSLYDGELEELLCLAMETAGEKLKEPEFLARVMTDALNSGALREKVARAWVEEALPLTEIAPFIHDDPGYIVEKLGFNPFEDWTPYGNIFSS